MQAPSTPRSALKKSTLPSDRDNQLSSSQQSARKQNESSSLSTSPPYRSMNSLVNSPSSKNDPTSSSSSHPQHIQHQHTHTNYQRTESKQTNTQSTKKDGKPSTNNQSSNATNNGSSIDDTTNNPNEEANDEETKPTETDDQKIDRVRRLLEYRQENTRYFDYARILGPQVFTDTVPLLFNCLLIIIFGNIIIYAPSIGLEIPTPTSISLVASASTYKYNDVPGACGTVPTLRIYVQGLIVAAYLLCSILGWFALRTQVTTNIRWPFLFVVVWCGGIAAWTFFGIGAVTKAAEEDCMNTSKFLFGFAVTELVLCPLLAGAIIIKWFATAIYRNIIAFIYWCQRTLRKWKEKRSRNQSNIT